MKTYELYGRNSYGSWHVATFYKIRTLNAFIEKFPPEEKTGYYYLEVCRKETRHSINGW